MPPLGVKTICLRDILEPLPSGTYGLVSTYDNGKVSYALEQR
jgi:hypothetical protein